eukprot:TRINITY_DN51785_c0_g1_i1.p1 TRINITY_DN51785_c0_g1~~TRINITY_DN51785_c0_g1_i1.p1  ORF type:complete len:276 (+),score=46.24 TRINITY_DN51785_c0_g1_i1:36-863(+)
MEEFGDFDPVQGYIRASQQKKEEESEILQHLKDYDALKQTLQEVVQRTQHEIMIPLGPHAFIPGELIHTNEVMVLLGDSWFALQSVHQCMGIIERRKKTLQTQLKAVKDAQTQILKKLDLIAEMKDEDQVFSAGAEIEDVEGEEYLDSDDEGEEELDPFSDISTAAIDAALEKLMKEEAEELAREKQQQAAEPRPVPKTQTEPVQPEDDAPRPRPKLKPKIVKFSPGVTVAEEPVQQPAVEKELGNTAFTNEVVERKPMKHSRARPMQPPKGGRR